MRQKTAGLGRSILRQWDAYTSQPHDLAVWSALAHVVLGIAALGIALMLTLPRTPPDRQIGWMRVNLAILLIAILCASITRYVRLNMVAETTVQQDDSQTLRGAIVGPVHGE